MLITLPPTQVPLYGEYDVVVIGGGSAGLAAAVGAAKHKARVLLVERYGFLGGMGTAGGVTNFAGLYGLHKGVMQQVVHGVADELLARLDALGGLNHPQDGMQGRIRVRSYDVSAYKLAADDWLAAHHVSLLFHAWASEVVMQGKSIDALIVQTKQGRLAIRAHTFIDCSGDADVAALAGVPFEVGDGRGSGLFPTTMFRVGNVDANSALAAIGDFQAVNQIMERVKDKYQFARAGAIVRPQKIATEWRANVTQIANKQGRAMDATQAQELSDGEVEGRKQVREFFRFLQNEVPGFANSHIVEVAPQVGIRESRRIKGVYSLTGDDILNSAHFDDVIGVNAWPMELHTQGKIEWGFPTSRERGYNDLPYRMLITAKIDNLLVAGRCASMEHLGQSAARASGACFVMGQAAGTAAAIRGAASVKAVSMKQLQQLLKHDGVWFS